MNNQFGCVTPWAFDENRSFQICRDKELAQKAKSMEKDFNSGFDGQYFAIQNNS